MSPLGILAVLADQCSSVTFLQVRGDKPCRHSFAIVGLFLSLRPERVPNRPLDTNNPACAEQSSQLGKESRTRMQRIPLSTAQRLRLSYSGADPQGQLSQASTSTHKVSNSSTTCTTVL
jgi:hypothetical protein